MSVQIFNNILFFPIFMIFVLKYLFNKKYFIFSQHFDMTFMFHISQKSKGCVSISFLCLHYSGIWILSVGLNIWRQGSRRDHVKPGHWFKPICVSIVTFVISKFLGKFKSSSHCLFFHSSFEN